ncbi:hypothetical protein NADFUDRAFT_81219 [Nadsonia fulvescens var. elongata DSM 6958]|uniref:DUF2433 domain-containing protein n=1 Tax=Nadsonia fulvescens var. elongata DSM 6958 TaxID=857566 RepID=A0A1E3PTC1_9ASCO|nr:hypothetical protein NADFUDRAFT_81219 [Nadsonia fulvescens var. elongata DSM 6958]
MVSVSVIGNLRILCIGELRGQLSRLNELAEDHRADIIIHTGNFGFYDESSISRIPGKTLKHIAMFSPLFDANALLQAAPEMESQADFKARFKGQSLSELPKFINGEMKLNVPIYAIYGSSEDIAVVDKFKLNQYAVPNLNIVDETMSYLIHTRDNKHAIRLLGIGGSLVPHKMFDIGDGRTSIAGSHGLMWMTALQLGQLVHTVSSSYQAQEIRIMITHPSPSREYLLNQIALRLRVDFTLSSGLHFFYGQSFNEYSINPSYTTYLLKLALARQEFDDIWSIVKNGYEKLLDAHSLNQAYLDEVLRLVGKMPHKAEVIPLLGGAEGKHCVDSLNGQSDNLENQDIDDIYRKTAFKSLWHFNLSDVSVGTLVLSFVNGKISIEAQNEGFDFAYRELNQSSPTGAEGVRCLNGTNNSNGVNISSDVNSTDGINVVNNANYSNDTRDVSRHAKPLTMADKFNRAPAAAPIQEINGNGSIDNDRSFSANDESTSSLDQQLPGIWMSNASCGDENIIKTYFDPQDLPHIDSVVIKSSFSPPHKKFALVYFRTGEAAQEALLRVDRDRTGKVSLIQSGLSGNNNNTSGLTTRGGMRTRGSRGGFGSSIRGGSRGGSSRGGSNSMRGSFASKGRGSLRGGRGGLGKLEGDEKKQEET